MNAGYGILLDKTANFLGGLLGNSAAHLLVTAAKILPLLQDPLRLPVQQRGQKCGNGIQVRTGLLQLMGVQIHILYPNRGGQNVHIPVVNQAAVRGRRRGPGLIVQCFCCIVIIVHHHKLG